MGTKDPRFDAYIRKAQPFARPILARLRELVHASCPAVVETVKWGHPSFEYHGILCGMASFKAHCAFGFWKHDLVVGSDSKSKEAMGSFGRLTRLDDLPSKSQFAGWVKTAMKLNEDGVKVVRQKTKPKASSSMHPELKVALARNAKALATFEAFPPGQKREYLDWVADAKQDATRSRRVASAVEWMAQGKRRNWKYENC